MCVCDLAATLMQLIKNMKNVFLFLFFVFLGQHLWHVEVLRLEVELELQLPAYTTDTAMQVLNHVFDRHHSSWPCRILNSLSKARDWTYLFIDVSQICFH